MVICLGPYLKRLLPVMVLLLLSTFGMQNSNAKAADEQIAQSSVLRLKIASSINPVSALIINEAIEKLNSSDDNQFLVIELDTPGGLDTSMRDIVKGIQGSKKPVIVFVSPSGSRAASAGAFITLSGHLSAMAESTSIGAASPVSSDGKEISDTMKSKIMNDASSYIESIAKARNKNYTLAVKFVTEAKSISESEALKQNIVDLLASDIKDLMKKVNKMEVKTIGGSVVLDTDNIKFVDLEISTKYKVLSIIADPNVAYILMMLGIYGLLFEIYNPGAIFPGVIGSIAIILALFAAQVIPINYTGLLLILLGVIFMLLEVFTPTFGILAIAGVVSFSIGSFILVNSPYEYYRVSLSVIIQAVVINLLFFGVVFGIVVKGAISRTKMGVDSFVGKVLTAIKPIEVGSKSSISLDGTFWSVYNDGSEKIDTGDNFTIVKRDGLTLKVRRDSSQA